MRLLHVDDGVYMGGATSEEIAMIPVYQFKSTPTTNNIPLTTSTLISHNNAKSSTNNTNMHHHSQHHHHHSHHNNPTTTTSNANITTNLSSITTTITNSSITSNTLLEDAPPLLNTNSTSDDYITIDLSKPIPKPVKHAVEQQQKPGRFDKLWLYLGLIDPPSEIEPEFEILEIPDVQDQVCVICLSTYEDGDILCKLW
jgi:hypothetical protein